MSEDTEILTKPAPDGDSRLGGVSVRAWLALIIVGTVCLMGLVMVGASIYQGDFVFKIEEPIYGMVYVVLGYFFGQSSKPTQPTKP